MRLLQPEGHAAAGHDTPDHLARHASGDSATDDATVARSAQDANGALCTAGRAPKWPRADAEMHGTADGRRDGDDGSVMSTRLWVGGGAR